MIFARKFNWFLSRELKIKFSWLKMNIWGLEFLLFKYLIIQVQKWLDSEKHIRKLHVLKDEFSRPDFIKNCLSPSKWRILRPWRKKKGKYEKIWPSRSKSKSYLRARKDWDHFNKSNYEKIQSIKINILGFIFCSALIVSKSVFHIKSFLKLKFLNKFASIWTLR